MHGCPLATTPPESGPATGPSDVPVRPAGTPVAEAPPRVRFADVLARERPGPRPSRRGAPGREEPSDAFPATSSLTRGGTEIAPCSRPHVAPTEPCAVPQVGLGDVQAAWGADGASLRFVVEDGFLAGLHMAFLLHGDVLDLSFQSSGGTAWPRIRELEQQLRDVLAAHGLELGRFDADGREARDGGGEEPDDPPRSPSGRGARAGGRTGDPE